MSDATTYNLDTIPCQGLELYRVVGASNAPI